MNVWTNAVITDKGRALLAKLTQGHTLDITKAVSGAGFVTPGYLAKQTDVTYPRQTLTFKNVSYPASGKCAIPVMLKNEGLETGYECTMVGIYATDPDEGEILFFIVQSVDANTGTTIPSESEMPGYSAEWTFYFQYGQADSVTVTVNSANTVTREEMEDYVSTNSSSNGVEIVEATGDGSAYTATIPNLTELKKGMVINIIPDTTSETDIPSLNINGLGAKNIKQRIAVNTALTVAAANDSWMVANKPIPLMYDGTSWVTITGRPSATSLYGVVPPESGGTGETSLVGALRAMFADGWTILSPHQKGDVLPPDEEATEGRLFLKKVTLNG